MYKELVARIRSNYGNVTDNDNIEKAANDLIENTLEGKGFPLPVVDLMQKLGFGVFRTDFRDRDQSGLIVVDSSLPERNKVFKSDRAILLNREDSVEHQRFTIAHELAHYIFDFNEQEDPVFYKAYYTTEDKTHELEEARAGRFAAALLMPKNVFERKYREIKERQGNLFSMPDAITELKQAFGTPATSVHRRIEELHLQE